uniref:Zgc:152891 n=1 Tax=Astyanax mexicanus TaxID=7994 RepID=W5KEZ0_ASTMX
MEGFHVAIRTSPGLLSGTYNTLWISLVGSQCDCPPVKVLPDGQCLMPDSIGTVVLVCLRLEARPGFPDQSWHCLDVQLKQRDEAAEVERFPCNKWITTADGDVELRSDRVCLVTWEKLQTLREHRARDLQKRQQQIRWGTFAEGSLRCIDMTSLQSLGPNLSFTRQSPGINLNYVRGFANRTEPWSSLEELEIVFIHNGKDNAIAKYVRAHWKDDTFFGYQCLNGCNPLQIRKIHHLPPNLQLTSEMLRDFLPVGSSLEQEMERGAIFLLDYGILDQLPANILNGKQTYLAAPLCLLHYNQYGEMKPIAIQLQKNAGPQNPVFLPSDSEPDWLLAKMWVKNADFQVHQLLSHLLRTHLLGEVCCIATLRRLPEIHPLHQLLMPHIKTCLQINIQARGSLLSTNGVFDKVRVIISSTTVELNLFVSSACSRHRTTGVECSSQVCEYVLDACCCSRFVGSWVDLYYSNDQEVQQDWELQSWIQEIFTEGFLSLAQTGFPQSFQTTAELSTFLTMVIFSSSALHAAVNFSQVDFNLWMPNCPAAMLRPPPQVKGSVTEEELLSFLPDVNSTCSVLTILLMLSQPAADYVALCHYREQYFSSGAPCRLVEAVLKELKDISEDITKRNSKMDIPYPYLSPDNIENSVAI